MDVAAIDDDDDDDDVEMANADFFALPPRLLKEELIGA